MNKQIANLGTIISLVSLAVVPVQTTLADSGSATYEYWIGAGILCGLDPSACPAIAEAPNGDTVEITGSGTLSIHPKSVTGGGTVVHKNAAGDVLASGTWTADKLLSFNGYGCGGGFPEDFCGGRANIRVTVWVGGAPVATGVLQVDCLIGKVPAGAVEGVRLAVHGVVEINFNKEVSGFTLFIKTL